VIEALWKLGTRSWGLFRNSILDAGNCVWSSCLSLPVSKLTVSILPAISV